MLWFNNLVNNVSVMLGQSHGFQMVWLLLCLALRHNVVKMWSENRTSQFRVKCFEWMLQRHYPYCRFYQAMSLYVHSAYDLLQIISWLSKF